MSNIYWKLLVVFGLLLGMTSCFRPITIAESMDSDGDGYYENEDCDDLDASINPGAQEVCDGVDQDCDGVIDDNPSDPTIWYIDADADGYGSTEIAEVSCTAPRGSAGNSEDCDDGNNLIHPYADEYCDGEGGKDWDYTIDYNCDGSLPGEDADGDGWNSCEECDDSRDTVYPGAEELCDGRDNDCDEEIPEDELDADNDTIMTCQGDCNDGNADVYPGAEELCDGLDNDCDGHDDIVGLWAFESGSGTTAVDSWEDNDGDLIDASYTNISYAGDYALQLDSEGARVEIDSEKLQMHDGLSWSFAFRAEDLGSGSDWNCLVTYGDTIGYQNAFAICLADAGLAFCTDEVDPGNCLFDEGSYVIGIWYQVTVSWDVDTGTRAIYVDGVETAFDTGVAPEAPVYDTGAFVMFGGDLNVNEATAFFNGQIDEVYAISCPVNATQAAQAAENDAYPF